VKRHDPREVSQAGPQFILDLPEAEYHAHDSVSRTMLKTFLDDRRDFEDKFVLDRAAPQKMPRYVDIGDACHVALLEPHKLSSYVVPIPEEHLGKGGRMKPSATAFKEEEKQAGRLALKQVEIDEVTRMADHFRKSPPGDLLQNGFAESSLFWFDDPTELMCRCRFDYIRFFPNEITPRLIIVIDVKITDDVKPRFFRQNFKKMKYWLQTGHYSNGLRAKWPDAEIQWYYVTQSRKAPHYRSILHHVNSTTVLNSQFRTSEIMRDLAVCLKDENFVEEYETAVNELSLSMEEMN
jgi:hypothetical protein